MSVSWQWWSTRLASVALMVALGAACQPAGAQQHDTTLGSSSVLRISDSARLPVSRRVVLGLHKAMIVELPADAQDILVSHPNTLDVVIRTPRRVFMLAKEVGEANVFFIGRDG